jgi:hypothetical protein
VTARPGFSAMLERLLSNGVRTILVETASRFARERKRRETGRKVAQAGAVWGPTISTRDVILDTLVNCSLFRRRGCTDSTWVCGQSCVVEPRLESGGDAIVEAEKER